MEEIETPSPKENQSEMNESCNTEDSLDYKQRDKKFTSVLYKRFGIILIVLSGLILPLILVTFFYHPGQEDQIALLIEQIIGFVLSAIGIVLGIVLLILSKRKLLDNDMIYEKLVNQKEED